MVIDKYFQIYPFLSKDVNEWLPREFRLSQLNMEKTWTSWLDQIALKG